MPLKLHTATPADIPAIINLQEKIWEPTYRSIVSPEQIQYMFDQMYTPEALLAQMTTAGHTFVVAENETELLGFASYSLADSTGNAFKLQKIYVLPTTQGTGLGKQLLAEIENRCRALGGVSLLLNVNRHNKAQSFYEKQGFVVIREEDIPIGPYWMNDYVMRKPLV